MKPAAINVWAFGMIVLAALDIATTHALLQTGLGEEANPAAFWMMEKIGVWQTLFVAGPIINGMSISAV